MRLSFCFLLLTLVVNVFEFEVQAAPLVTHDLEPVHTSPKDPPERPPENEVDKSSLHWKSLEPLTPEEQTTLATTSRGLEAEESFDRSLRLGILSGSFNETHEQKILQFVAFRFDFNKTSFETWQGEIKLGSGNFVHLTVGKKFPFMLEQIGAPYYKFAAGNLLDSSEGLGSIFNFKKFQGIAAIGLDDFFLFHHRLQMELAASVAIVGAQLETSLGFAF
jgi:hypothetical protein